MYKNGVPREGGVVFGVPRTVFGVFGVFWVFWVFYGIFSVLFYIRTYMLSVELGN